MQCACDRNKLGREGNVRSSFWVWQSNKPPSPSPLPLPPLPLSPTSSGLLCESVSGEMRHSNRFDIHLVSYQVILHILPGLALSLSLAPQIPYIKLLLKCFRLSASGSYDRMHGGLLFNLAQEKEMKMTCRILTQWSDKNFLSPTPRINGNLSNAIIKSYGSEFVSGFSVGLKVIEL